MNKCFLPTDEKIKWATELLKEYELQKAQNAGAFAFMGRMIDMPSILSAQHAVHIGDLARKKQKP